MPSSARPTVSVIIPVHQGGESFLRCLSAVTEAKPLPDRDLFWFQLWNKEGAVRRGKWKLIETRKEGVRLFDLSADLKEEIDVSDKNPELTQMLADELTRMQQELTQGAKMKTAKSNSKTAKSGKKKKQK